MVTGGCGFIGSNFIRMVLNTYPDTHVINVDSLTYAGNLKNNADYSGSNNYTFLRSDISDESLAKKIIDITGTIPGLIVNFAAESHVDRSFENPELFYRTNIIGTINLLEMARSLGSVRFIQISTDEVYGSLGTKGRFTETSPIRPETPYAASKASADLVALSYYRTYGIEVLVARGSNNYGPYQYPEKLIPLMIINAERGLEMPLYGDGRNVRDWIYVDDFCRGIMMVMENGKSGEIYNFGGNAEYKNIDIVSYIADVVAGSRDRIRFVEDRVINEMRFAMDYRKATREFGWRPQIHFWKGLDATIEWYLTHRDWWMPIVSGEYKEFYRRWYEDRIKKSKSSKRANRKRKGILQ